MKTKFNVYGIPAFTRIGSQLFSYYDKIPVWLGIFYIFFLANLILNLIIESNCI